MEIKLTYYLLDTDGTEKFVFNNKEGVLEIVRINTKEDRDIYCVPSMYQCLLGCTMCYLTINKIKGSNKKLESTTIDQVIQYIRTNYPTNKKDIQVSVMGVGEPLLNKELIFDLCENINYSRVSISTIFPYLPDFEFPDKLKIHFSLHSPIDEIRKKFLPNAKASIEDAFNYLDMVHKGKSEIHYTLMEGVNDSDKELVDFKTWLRRQDTVKFLDFKTSEKTNTNKSNKLTVWMKELEPYCNVEYYNPPGERIQGSCGLFTEGFYGETQDNSFKLMLEKYSQPLKN